MSHLLIFPKLSNSNPLDVEMFLFQVFLRYQKNNKVKQRKRKERIGKEEEEEEEEEEETYPKE